MKILPVQRGEWEKRRWGVWQAGEWRCESDYMQRDCSMGHARKRDPKTGAVPPKNVAVCCRLPVTAKKAMHRGQKVQPEKMERDDVADDDDAANLAVHSIVQHAAHAPRSQPAAHPGPFFAAAVAVGSTVGSPSRSGCKKLAKKAAPDSRPFCTPYRPFHPFSPPFLLHCTLIALAAIILRCISMSWPCW